MTFFSCLLPLNGLNVRNNRKTLSILNIRVAASDSTLGAGIGPLPRCMVAKSIIDIITSEPSIIFQPECKYVSDPHISPAATILINISMVNITVKI
jgi:hypothetical protein